MNNQFIYEWGYLGGCLGGVWGCLGMFGGVWGMLGGCIGHVLGDVWGMFWKCLGDVLGMSGTRQIQNFEINFARG